MDINLGKKFIQEKKFKKALLFFLKELKKNNKNINIHFYLGFIYFQINKIKESINNYKLAFKISPKSIEIILNLADAYLVSGSFLSAERLYLKAIQLNKNEPRGYYGLYAIKPSNIYKYSKNLNDIKDLENYIVTFLLSKIAKQNNDYELELKYLNIFQKQCFKARNDFNLQGQFYYNKIISNYFNKIKFKNNYCEDKSLSKISPIFIIGLPRSGSTLIESMINTDYNTVSLGETSVFNTEIINLIKNQIFKKNFEIKNFSFNLDLELLSKNIIERYKDYHSKDSKDLIFVDKSLENFFNIEVILKIYPNAKFINCRRNYKDNAIAIYQSMLPELPWTHSISEILEYMDNYIKIINFYEKKFQAHLLSINLEDLTNDQKLYSKKIFEFCKLKWTPDILNFYKKKNLLIKTLSNNQLRKKIFTYDINKYTKYDKLLDNFKDKYKWLNF